ncbi:MAG: hypothetical protein OEZ14_05695 [Acidimicrobiia bacterium]|nr:hypothetical protein [Acidimicrobiia bacterium]MDH5520010.1 hypothetical protein [Acidimicrobiia bacterium]
MLPRSTEWLAAVEAGTCVPAPFGLQLLRHVLSEAAGRPIDPWAVLHEIEEDPWGDQARLLRRRHDLQFRPDQNWNVDESDGLLPVVDEIEYRDRLLIVFPLTVFLLLVGVALLARPDGELGVGVEVDLAVSALAFSVFTTSVYFELRWLNSALDRLTAWFRQGSRRRWFGAMEEVRNLQGHQLAVQDGWYRPGEFRFLIPSCRDRFRSLAREIDISERVAVVLFLFAGLLLAPSVLVAVHAQSVDPVQQWLLLIAVSAVVAMRLLYRLRGRTLDAVDTALVGYGDPKIRRS